MAEQLLYHRELWVPGEIAHFEYRCYEGHDSSDAELWYRSQQSVTVIGLSKEAENELGEGFLARGEAGAPLVYEIQFSDGERFEAWEDELLTDVAGYSRPAPPKPQERDTHED